VKLVKEQITFDYEGKTYKADRANFEQVELILEKLSKVGEDGLKSIRIQKEFLKQSGLDEALIKTLQMNHMKMLFKEILGTKKD